jgi:hypothetical protein
MESPAPPQRDHQKDADAALVELVRRFLFRALRSRVVEAMEGRSHTGPLSAEISAELDEISRVAAYPPVNNLHNLGSYYISRFRELSRNLEPSQQLDVYAHWTRYSKAEKRVSPETLRQEPTQVSVTVARIELVSPQCRLDPLHYTSLAQAYLQSVAVESLNGLDAITELFSFLQLEKLTKTFTSAQHFSRLHLQLVEDTVLAACRHCLQNPVPVTA